MSSGTFRLDAGDQVFHDRMEICEQLKWLYLEIRKQVFYEQKVTKYTFRNIVDLPRNVFFCTSSVAIRPSFVSFRATKTGPFDNLWAYDIHEHIRNTCIHYQKNSKYKAICWKCKF